MACVKKKESKRFNKNSLLITKTIEDYLYLFRIPFCYNLILYNLIYILKSDLKFRFYFIKYNYY